jgi:predicted small lipoprotein YifL
MRNILLIMLLSACLGACGKKPNLLEQPAHQNIPSYPAAEPVPN